MSWIVRLFHVIVFGSFLGGILTLLGVINSEENECKMTYMWEYPEYAKVGFDEDVNNAFPNYHLHFYGEGHYMKLFDPDDLTGIPVLFIPGNGGCFRQARSIGSVLLRKSQNIGWQPHFNVFTVDLNDGELVAVYGGTLESQVKFINHCIRKILSMYAKSKSLQYKPTSVVLVGHSMGGVVAKSIFSDSEFLKDSVHTILTFASPHKAPVISLDHQIPYFYEKQNEFWKDNYDELKHITLLSVAGGQRDFQVNSALTEFSQNTSDNKNHISTIVTHVPRVHVSTDHQCSVWCNQLVLATARALFDMVDDTTQQITHDGEIRSSVLRHHFVKSPGYKSFGSKKKKINLLKQLQEECTLSKWTIQQKPKNEIKYIYFDIKYFIAQEKDLLVAKTETSNGKWVFLKEMGLTNYKDISSEANETPNFIVLKLNLTKLQNEGYEHIIFNYKAATNLEINIVNSSESSRHVIVPYSLSQLWLGEHKLTIPSSNEYFEFYFIGFHSIFHSYEISVCGDNWQKILFEYNVPWRIGNFYSTKSYISLNLPSLSPEPSDNNSFPSLNIHKDKGKELTLSLKSDFLQIIANIFRIYGTSIISMFVINVFLSYSTQMKFLLYQSSVKTFGDCHSLSAKPYKIQPFISITKLLYSTSLFLSIWVACKLPKPDFILLEQDYNVWYSFAPFCMFIFAYEAVKIVNNCFRFFVEYLEHICGIIVKGKIEIVFNTNALPIHAVLLAMLLSKNASLVFIYICTIQLLKTSMLATHQKSISEASNNETTQTDHSKQEYEINYTMLIMWGCLSICFIPSLISVLKGYNFPDSHEVYHASLAVLLFLAQSRSTKNLQNSSMKFVSWFYFPLVILCSLICFISLHRLSTFILLFIFMHSIMLFF